MKSRTADPAAAPPAQDRAAFLGSRVAILLRDPAVARRVASRLARAAEAADAGIAGTPPCFRATGTALPAPVRIRSSGCRAICQSVDCLCGRYPRRLTDQEISDGQRLEPLAV